MYYDEGGCLVNTPVVMLKGKYFFKELFEVSGPRKKQKKNNFKDLYEIKKYCIFFLFNIIYRDDIKQT